MWCQSRNRRPSATSCFQRPTSYAFHQPHPSAHRTSSYPEDSSHLSLRKTFLNCLNDSPPKVFLSFRRQRASILVSHARQTNTLFSDCHLYYAPISNSVLSRQRSRVRVSSSPPFLIKHLRLWKNFRVGTKRYKFRARRQIPRTARL